MTAEAETVMKSPSRTVRIETSWASAGRSALHAAASARTAIDILRLTDMVTACAAACSRATSPGLLHACAGPLGQGQDRVAVGPGNRECGGYAPRQPLVAQVLRRIERHLDRARQRQAEHVLGVVRHARRVAALVPLEDLEAVLDSPVAQPVAARVQPGLLAHLADRGVAQRLRFARDAARDRLPEILPAGAFHHQ